MQRFTRVLKCAPAFNFVIKEDEQGCKLLTAHGLAVHTAEGAMPTTGWWIRPVGAESYAIIPLADWSKRRLVRCVPQKWSYTERIINVHKQLKEL